MAAASTLLSPRLVIAVYAQKHLQDVLTGTEPKMIIFNFSPHESLNQTVHWFGWE